MANKIITRFSIRGDRIPASNGYMLRSAILRRLPELGDEPFKLHSICGHPRRDGLIALRDNAHFLLISGREIDFFPLYGSKIQLGANPDHYIVVRGLRQYEITPYPNMKGALVFIKHPDYSPDQQIAHLLKKHQIEFSNFWISRSFYLPVGDKSNWEGYKVMVFGLTPESSIRLQSERIGKCNAFGAGFFVHVK